MRDGGRWRWLRMLAAGLGLAVAAPVHAHPGYDARIAALGEQLADAPDDRALRLRRAEAFRRAGHLHEALRDLAVIARVDARDPAMLVERALVRIAQDRPRAGERDLDTAIAGGLRSAPAFRTRAQLREATGRLEAARGDYDAAIALGGTPDLYLARARVHAALGDHEAAAAGLAEGCAALADPVVLRLALVDAERRRGAPARALAVIDAMLASHPDHAEWVLLRGEILDELDRGDEAVAERLRALALSHAAIARRPTALHRLGRARIYLALDVPRAALVDLELVLAGGHELPQARALLQRAKEAPP